MSSSLFRWRASAGTAHVLLTLLAFGFPLAPARSASAQVLVLAPHPDDDVITSAGVIYRARQAGAPVWVMYMTNGDYAPTGTAWGYTREDEAVAAQALLGVPEDNLVFLGYPDGSLQLLYGAFFNTPYIPAEHGYQGDRSILEAMSRVAYAGRGLGRTDYHRYAFGTAAENTGSNVQADLVHFLADRRPTDIYTVGRCDRHSDHSHTYEFLMSALQQVRASTPSYDPHVWQTIVWAGFNVPETVPPDPDPPDADDWPLAPDPATLFTEPVRLSACLAENSLIWSQRQSVVVPAPMLEANFGVNLKARAIDLHATQGGFNPVTARHRSDGHISAFVHRDEFFYRFRASGSPPALDGGARPMRVDAGADTGTRDAATEHVDAGRDSDGDSGVDSGSPVLGGKLDAGSGDGGTSSGADAADGRSADDLDSGGPVLEGDAQLGDAVMAAAAQPGQDASSSVGTTEAGVSSWPGDDGDLDRALDGLLGDDADDTKRGKDSGCSLNASGASAGSPLGLVLAALATLLIRRRAGVAHRPSARRD